MSQTADEDDPTPATDEDLQISSPSEPLLDLWTAKLFFDTLVEPFPERLAKQTSRAERQLQDLGSSTLVYGEITFEAFSVQLLKLRELGGMKERGGVFYDIGCGTGKPAFAAALLHPFKACVGIEILQGLHTIATRLLDRWRADIQPKLPPSWRSGEIGFVHGDATAIDWSDGDVIFMNSTCFGDQLLEGLARQAEGLKPGSFVITTTRRLPSRRFEILDVSKMAETWGTATVFIQQRKEN